jgi:hypothetical protein
LLYQVFGNGFLTQSQPTTIHGLNQGKRTRTAQQFAFGSSDPSGTSYNRERKVVSSETDFYLVALKATIEDYNDLCKKDGFAGRTEIYSPREGFNCTWSKVLSFKKAAARFRLRNPSKNPNGIMIRTMIQDRPRFPRASNPQKSKKRRTKRNPVDTKFHNYYVEKKELLLVRD